MSLKAQSGIVHVAGPYEKGLQYCVICGGIIIDARNEENMRGHPLACGFPEGPVTIKGNMRSAHADEDLPACTIKLGKVQRIEQR